MVLNKETQQNQKIIWALFQTSWSLIRFDQL